ncbi:MAG: hypothetical protein J1F32_06910 [Erysipelotrichales bacterium]|nr:hypothetical protein [Erysipelotrichales bacterium]
MEKSVKEFVLSSLSGVKNVVDSTNIMGSPINISEEEVIIPISRLTFGFGVGGSELKNNEKNNNLLFEYASDLPLLGGSLGGLTISPEAFIYINRGKVDLIRMKENKTLYDRLFEIYKDVAELMKKSNKKGPHKRT